MKKAAVISLDMDQRQAFYQISFLFMFELLRGCLSAPFGLNKCIFFPLLSWYKGCNLSWPESVERHIFALTQLKIHKL